MSDYYDRRDSIPEPVMFPGKPDGFENPSALCHDSCWLGTLKAEDGSLLSWRHRNKVYPSIANTHIARTPFHAIRYAIREYTRPGEIVLDPFMGSGTTGAEALQQGRRTIGIEIEFADVAREVLKHFSPTGWTLYEGDAERLLHKVDDGSVALINFSNPYPDGADYTHGFLSPKGAETRIELHHRYVHPGNAAHLKGDAYWRKMERIQIFACEKLKRGGHAVFVIKDFMRDKKVFPMHERLAALLPDDMVHVGTFCLPHYPTTLGMNTYIKRYGIRSPMEQICPVFRKE